MIVSPCSSHSAGIDVVRNGVVIVRKLSCAESAHAALGRNLSVHQLPHLGVGTDFPISTSMLRIIDATDANLAGSSFLRDGFSSAASNRTVNWAKLISAESHKFLQHEIAFLWIWQGFFRMR